MREKKMGKKTTGVGEKSGTDDKAAAKGSAEEGLLLDLPKKKCFMIMAVIYFLWFLDYATRFVISPMFPALKADLGLSDSQLGLLTTIVLASITVLALPVSVLIDRWRRGRLISIMAVVWSGASVFSGTSANFSHILISRGFLGAGESAFASGGMAMISAMFKKERRATITGIWNTAIPLGIAVGMALGGWVTLHWGWRKAFMLVGIPGIILGVMAWFFPDYKNEKRPSAGSANKDVIATLRELLKNKTLVILYTSVALYMMYNQAINYWGATYMVRYFKLDLAQAGILGGSQALLSFVASPLGGIFADKISRKNPANKIRLCFFSIFACMLFYVLGGGVLFCIPLLFVGSFFSMFFIAAQMTSTQEIVPAHQRATSYGLYVVTQYLLGGLWGPLLTGVLSDMKDLGFALGVMTVVGLIGCFGYLVAAHFFNNDYRMAREKEKACSMA